MQVYVSLTLRHFKLFWSLYRIYTYASAGCVFLRALNFFDKHANL